MTGALISTLIALPLLAAAVVCVLPLRAARLLGWAALATEALLSLRLLDADYTSAGYRLVERAELGPLHYAVGIDGLSVWLVLAITWLSPLVLGGGGDSRRTLSAVLLGQGAAVGALCAFDLVLLLLCFELTLLPLWLGCGGDGAGRRQARLRVALELVAGAGMLLGVWWLGEHYRSETGARSFDLVELGRLLLPVETQRGYFLLFAAPFLMRLGLPPLHGGLQAQLAASSGPMAGLSLVLGAPLSLHGLLRVPMALFPAGSHRAGVTLAAVAAIGVLLVGLSALGARERCHRALLARVSIAHAGVLLLGALSITGIGIAGALTASVAVTFGLVGVAQLAGSERRGLRAAAWVASLALPPFGGFVGLLLVFAGALRAEHLGVNGTALVCVGALGLVLLSAAALRAGGASEGAAERAPVDGAAVRAWPDVRLALPVLAVLALGLHPAPVLERIEASADHFTRVYTAKLSVSDTHPGRRGLLERVPTP